MENIVTDVAVIGGGASGLACAIAFAQKNQNKKIVVFEALNRVGKKILATGNGKCNLSNSNASPEHYHCSKKGFVDFALKKYDVNSNLDFFKNMSLLCYSDSFGRIYPSSNQANSVLDCLRFEAEKLGVDFVCDTHIDKIEKTQKGFILNNSISAKAVVIATGGKSNSKQGSDGSGFKLLKQLGHSITPLFPALVQLDAKGDFFPALKGIRATATATLIINNKPIHTEKGEIQFTQRGLSGIAIMQLSSIIARAKSDNIKIRLDLADRFSEKELFDLLFSFSKSSPEQIIENLLIGILPKRLGQVILKQSGYNSMSAKIGTLTKKDINNIVTALKAWDIKFSALQGFDVSQVTSGGADTVEFYSDSMMSKKHENLYCIGEVLDVDGECGGYNLNWAWSSGRLAGEYIAERLK
ncbi:MAG: NAD(P)/FAD-dependent oxidoreductase [Clostridiales bacterium]|nr:NAD(P)/FAD-dependent oxidoreductase [Clostridiales bacterium]